MARVDCTREICNPLLYMDDCFVEFEGCFKTKLFFIQHEPEPAKGAEKSNKFLSS